MIPEKKEIRAFYNDNFIRVYQAFNNAIADTALKNQTFIPPFFKLERTTWIKPSFCWMMYRCGWGNKDNQERILSIDIKIDRFLWALQNSCLSHYDKDVYLTKENWEKEIKTRPVIIQWDPERDIYLNKLPYKTIQIGLTPIATRLYLDNWILKITDITEYARNIKILLDENRIEEVSKKLTLEKRLLIQSDIAKKIGIH